MAEQLIRTSFVDVSGQPRQGSTSLRESRVDAERYLQPLVRAHASALHSWGIAEGLRVSATIGVSGLTIGPGVALDAAGRHICVAEGGSVKLDDGSLAAVGQSGVEIPTTGPMGATVLTIAWDEVFDRVAFHTDQLFQMMETPLIRLRPAADFTNDGEAVVLAHVELGENGAIAAVSATERTAVGVSVGRIDFLGPVSDSTDGVATLAHQTAGSITVGAKGNLKFDTALALPAKGMRIGTAAVSVLEGDLTLSTKLRVPASGIQIGDITVSDNGAASVSAQLRLPDSGVQIGQQSAVGNNFQLAAGRVIAGGERGLRLSSGTGESSNTILTSRRDGRLCIGGTNPRALLTVDDPTAEWDTVAFRRAALGPNWSYIHRGENGDWYIRSAKDTGNVVIQDVAGGRVRIGTVGLGAPSRTERLQVGGDPAGPLTHRPAAVFWGDVQVIGKLTKSTSNFKIDHPDDPANKYLCHSAIESDEMKNVYDGAVELDDRGTAVIELPGWFEGLNEKLRYQLTPIGAAAPNLHVAEKVSGGRFAIAGVLPGWRSAG